MLPFIVTTLSSSPDEPFRLDTLRDIPIKHYSTVRRGVLNAIASSPAALVTPLLDVGVVTGNWTWMIDRLAREAQQSVPPDVIEKLAYGVWLNMTSYTAGSLVLNGILAIVPVTGVIAVMGSSGVINAYLTYRLGKFLSHRLTVISLSDDDALLSLLAQWMLRPSRQDARELIAIIRHREPERFIRVVRS